MLDLRESPLEDVHGLANKFNVKVDYFQADVSNEESLKAAFDKAVSALGRLDGIVTAAGIAIDKPFVDQGWDEVNKVIQVNVSLARYPTTCWHRLIYEQSLGSFFSAQLAVQQIQKQGTAGSIVMIASITSHVNLPGYRMVSKPYYRIVKHRLISIHYSNRQGTT